MVFKKFSNNKIFQQLAFNYRDSLIECWTDFIAEQDIGVICIGEAEMYSWEFEYTYIIIDEKKWLFSKLKYGI